MGSGTFGQKRISFKSVSRYCRHSRHREAPKTAAYSIHLFSNGSLDLRRYEFLTSLTTVRISPPIESESAPIPAVPLWIREASNGSLDLRRYEFLTSLTTVGISPPVESESAPIPAAPLWICVSSNVRRYEFRTSRACYTCWDSLRTSQNVLQFRAHSTIDR